MSDLTDELKYDWYAVLGCNSQSTKGSIEKAARKFFLKYHPDKTSDPQAPELFLRVQKAKEILLDDTKRKAIDDAKVLVTKRQDYDNERNKSMDVRRKRMREDLEAVLEKGRKTADATPSNQMGPGRQQKDHSVDFDRLRKEGASLREATARDIESKEAKRAHDFMKEQRSQAKQVELEGGLCQIKIKWKRSRQSHSDESLALIFKCFGDIEAVTMIGDKGNSATILFSTELSATNAVTEYAASTEYRVTIPFKDTQDNKKKAAIFTHIYASSAPSQPYTAAELFSTSEKDHSQESDLMRQMRRTVEREEIIRSLNGTQHTATTSSSTSKLDDKLPSNDASSFLGNPQKAPTVDTVSAPSFAFKEADVLQRMMAAAIAKKKLNASKIIAEVPLVNES